MLGGAQIMHILHYNWIDPIANNHNPISTWDVGDSDNGYKNISDIGFSFSFFSASYNSLYINTNGYVSFNQGYLLTGDDIAIPNNAEPNNFIAGCAMDLDFSNSIFPESKIYYASENNRFIITYYHAID